MKKSLALTLVLIMVLCMLPSVAFAAETLNTGYGTFSYEKGKRNVDVTLEIYLDGEKVFNQTQEIQRAASASFKASEGYFIEKVEINKGIWGTASNVYSPTPKSKEYSGKFTPALYGNSTIKLRLVKSCKLTVEYQYTDKSAGNSDIKKYQGYTKEVYPGEEFKSNEWNYYDAKDVREYYTSSVKDGNGNDVKVKGTPTGRYFNGTITEDATYTVTFAPANTNDFLEINSYEGRGVTGNNMNADFRYYGYEISGENGADKVYIVKDGKLTADALKNTRNDDPGIIIKDGKTYKYVFAGLGGDLAQIKDVYYDSSEQNWYYAYEGSAPIRIPVTEEGRINFVYKETTNSYILNYDANGGKNAPEKQEEKTSAPSATFTIPQTTPTYDGYDFLGWADTKDGPVKYKAGDDLTLTYTSGVTEKTIYAVWEKIQSPVTIYITYNGNAGNDTVSNLPDPTTSTIPNGQYDAPFKISDIVPTRNDYDFLGWADSADAAEPQYQPGNTINVSGDKCFYAVWKATEIKPDIPTPTIDNIDGNIKVNVICTSANESQTYGLVTGGFTYITPALNNDGVYECTITATPSVYCAKYSADTRIAHEEDTDYNNNNLNARTLKLQYDSTAKKWKPIEDANPLLPVGVQCGKNSHGEQPETTGTLIVTKTVSGNASSNSDEFEFTVNAVGSPSPDGPAYPPKAMANVASVNQTANPGNFVNGVYTFDLKHGDSMTISDLPAGTYYVQETNPQGYTVNVNGEVVVGNGKMVELKAGKTVTLNFNNHKDNGGGNGGGGYYYPTTTPVPVIVIPPKTGDMTVWQSILHFLGIR